VATISDIVEHVKQTVKAPPTATVTRFPHLLSGGFRDADLGGGRIELEEMVGQDGVFEVSISEGTSVVVPLGGAVPTSFTDTFPVRLRYEGYGSHDRGQILERARLDQHAVVDALQRSSWVSVSGLVTLAATPGNISQFVLRDDAGKEFEGYIAEVDVSVSYDI
jgi:hypothetical protein